MKERHCHYQARVENAAEHDPEIVAAFKYNPDVQAAADPNKATSTLAFFDPSHIRYHRNQGIPLGSCAPQRKEIVVCFCLLHLRSFYLKRLERSTDQVD